MEEYNNVAIPKFMKLVMLFIDRVGFPVLAFILMFFMSYVSLNKITTALQENSKVLTGLCIQVSTGLQDHNIIKEDLKRIMIGTAYASPNK